MRYRLLLVVCLAWLIGTIDWSTVDYPRLALYLSLVCFGAWTTPRTWVDTEVVTASLLNTHIRDNLNALRVGGIAIASQAANDFIYASSSTQLARLAAVSGQVPQYNGSAWVMTTVGTQQHPVGAVLEFVVATNPGTLLGYGTWAALGAGRVTVCINAADPDFDTVRETGGTKTHTLTTAEMPVHTHLQNSHNHTQNAHSHSLSNIGNTIEVYDVGTATALDNSGSKTTSSETATNIATTAVNQNEGGGGAHNNLQPYVVVYRWERTA